GPGRLTLRGVSWDAAVRMGYGVHLTLKDLELAAEGSDLAVQGTAGCTLTIDNCTVSAEANSGNAALGGFDSIELVRCELVSEGGPEGSSVYILPKRVWSVDKAKRTVTVTDAVTADSPVLLAIYDADGRFIGLSIITAPGETGLPETGRAVLFRVDALSFAPKCAAEEIAL
ncbi:MAG: hypothetical protein J5827_02335, partial [Oscillospiraceae bacterium]|nr:hypothetical protein [Oscillospiraceae bacterium]